MVEQGSGIVKAMLGFIRTGQEEKLCNVNQLVSETKRLLGDQFHQELVLRLSPLLMPEMRCEAGQTFVRELLKRRRTSQL